MDMFTKLILLIKLTEFHIDIGNAVLEPKKKHKSMRLRNVWSL